MEHTYLTPCPFSFPLLLGPPLQTGKKAFAPPLPTCAELLMHHILLLPYPMTSLVPAGVFIPPLSWEHESHK